MKAPTRFPALALLLPLFFATAAAAPARAAQLPTEKIEEDLSAVLREIETLSAELDRIGEVAAVPKATSLRIEIRRNGEVAAPVSATLLLSGKVEAEHEFGRAERDAFLSDGGSIVWNVPVLPGTHNARLILSHPNARRSPSIDFPVSLKTGDVFLLRLTMGFAKGSRVPTLTASPEK